jgi:uncharacterized protein YjiS (DUF1127 family)
MVVFSPSATRAARSGRATAFAQLLRLPRWLAARLLLWRRRHCERTLIASLDHRALRDIGLTRLDVEREYRKPFWRE